MKKFLIMIFFMLFFVSYSAFCIEIGVLVEKKSFAYNKLYDKIESDFKIPSKEVTFKKMLYSELSTELSSKRGSDFYIVIKIGSKDSELEKQFNSIKNKMAMVYFDKKMPQGSQKSLDVDTVASSTKTTESGTWERIFSMVLEIYKKKVGD